MSANENKGKQEEQMNEQHIQTIIAALEHHGIEPVVSSTAAAGQDYGHMSAWEIGDGDYAILWGDNASTQYAISDDISDPEAWMIPDDNDPDVAPVVTANIRGIDSFEAADPETTAHPVRILVTHYYYGPIESTDWLRTDDGHADIREYETYAEAAEDIEELESGDYCLSHNESGRPTLTIVEA
jgi:hypothetical protein